MSVYLVFPLALTRANLVSATTEETGYPAERMWSGRRLSPARSTADGAEWNAVWDSGPYGRSRVDTICAITNGHNIAWQMNGADVWTSPAVDQSLDLTYAGISSYTKDGGTITRTDGGTWTVNSLIGCGVTFDGTSNAYRITANTATVLNLGANDLSGESGSIFVTSTKRWTTITQVQYRYLRVHYYAMNTPDGYLSTTICAGIRYELPGATAVEVDRSSGGVDYTAGSGATYRMSIAFPRSTWALNLTGVSRETYDALWPLLANIGQRPIGLIPDHTNSYDWYNVLPDTDISWRVRRTVVTMVEAL